MGMRRNGFQRPHHILQLVSWFVFSFLGLSYHFFILPSFSTWVHRLILSLVYWCFAGPMVYFGWRMTASDPLDDVVIEARQQRKLHWAGTPPAPEVYDYPLEDEPHSVREARRCDPHILALSASGDAKSQRNWCPYCFEHVHPSSKHCKLCDKCVSDFDHHCKWLNSCVGGKNYHLFFTAMSMALLLLAYQCALSLYLFIETFMDNYEGASPALYINSNYSGASGFERAAFQVLMGVTVCISAPLFLSLLQLFMLHVYLWKRKITTYEWIMERRNEIKAKEDAMAARASLKGKEEEEAGNTTAGGGTMMRVAPKRTSNPGETPRGDEEGRVLSNLTPGETDPYPGYLNSLRESANQRRMEEEAAVQQQQWQPQDGTMRFAQRLEEQQYYSQHVHHQQAGGVGISTYSQQQQDTFIRDGHEFNRDASFQQSTAISPQRTVTVTAAEVGLSTNERAMSGGIGAGRLGRPISASDREASQISGTDSPHVAGTQPYVQHGRYGSGSNMNTRASRPTSAKDIQQQPHHVTMHVTVTGPGARSSFSSEANAQPDGSPTSSVRGSNKAYSLPPIVGRAGSLEMQSPLKSQEAISPSSYDSPIAHHSNTNNLHMPMPGMIGSNEVSPSSMKKKDMLTSPTSINVLPNTPTANMSFAAGLNTGSAVANHQPAMYGDANNVNARSMEEEAEAFLNDPTATEPRFQQTESQRARGAARRQ